MVGLKNIFFIIFKKSKAQKILQKPQHPSQIQSIGFWISANPQLVFSFIKAFDTVSHTQLLKVFAKKKQDIRGKLLKSF